MGLTGIFTQKGKALEAKLLSGAALVVSKVTAGSGVTAQDDTSLQEEQQILAVGSPHIRDNIVTLPVTLVAARADAGYTLTEVGIYAVDPDDGEILCRIYRLSDPLHINPASRLAARFELEEIFSDTGNLQVPNSPGGLVSEGDLSALMGAPGGIATLDSSAIVPVQQMPYASGTEDLVAGETPLEDGHLYFVYE